MIKKLVVLFFVLIAIPSFAQKEKDLFIDLKGALALPLGDFAARDLEGGSFATSGIVGKLDITWFTFENWGVRAGFSGAIIPVKADALATAKVANDPFLQDLIIRSDPYTYMYFNASVLYRRHLSEKWKLYGLIGTGMMYMETPYQLHKSKYFMTGPDYFEITAAGDYALMCHLGAEIEYEIVDKWSVVGGINLNYANATFTFDLTGGGQRIDKRKVFTVESSLGIRLYF